MCKRDSEGTEKKLQKMQSQLDYLSNILSQLVKVKEKKSYQAVIDEKITGKKCN